MKKSKIDKSANVDLDEYLYLQRATNELSSGPLGRWLVQLPCISGYGLGLRIKDGEVTDSLCTIIGVQRKLPLNQLKLSELIPKSLKIADPQNPKKDITILTDVLETGIIRPHGIECDRVRPCPVGYSIAHKDVTSGTLGCWVIDNNTFEPLFLSNNHVLANANNGKVGDLIYQPGPSCSGKPNSNKYGTLHRFATLQGDRNLVDAAVAKPLTGNGYTNFVTGIGEIYGTVQLDASHLGRPVWGFGNRSGIHDKTIISVNYSTGPIDYDPGKGQRNYSFINQIALNNNEPQKYIPGDSGTTFILKEPDGNYYAGLHFAGSDKIAIGNHIRDVFDSLNVGLCIIRPALNNESEASALRRFRDEILIQTEIGKQVIKLLAENNFAIAESICHDTECQPRLREIMGAIAKSFEKGEIKLSKPLPMNIVNDFNSWLQGLNVPKSAQWADLSKQIHKALEKSIQTELTEVPTLTLRQSRRRRMK